MTKSVTAGVLAGVADIVCQVMYKPNTCRHKFDYKRTASLVSYSLFINGPMLHLAYENIYPRWGNSLKGLAYKFTFSQTVYTAFSMALFLTMVPLINGKSLK